MTETSSLHRFVNAYANGHRHVALDLAGNVLGTSKTEEGAWKLCKSSKGGTIDSIVSHVAKNYATLTESVSFHFSDAPLAAKLFVAVSNRFDENHASGVAHAEPSE